MDFNPSPTRSTSGTALMPEIILTHAIVNEKLESVKLPMIVRRLLQFITFVVLPDEQTVKFRREAFVRAFCARR